MISQRSTTLTLRALAASEGVELPVRGDCMRPLLESGRRVRIRRSRLYLPGDVVAFRSGGDRLLVHRVLGYTLGRRGPALIAKGDHLSREDEPVRLDQVIGRMVDDRGRPVRVPLGRRLRCLTLGLRVILRRSLHSWASATSS